MLTLVASLVATVPSAPEASAFPAHQPGFALDAIFGGYTFTTPTAVRFAPDGQVFVAEKAGRILGFDSIYDSTPTQVLDIRDEVHSGWDRGLLGLAVDPDFPAEPYIYIFYTVDTGDQWPALDGSNPNPGPWNDTCPTPPGANDDGCVVDNRLSRLPITPSGVAGAEHVLLEGLWCQQFPSHSAGDLTFDANGYLVASAGDGAGFIGADLGEKGGDPEAGNRTPVNPCNDPDPTPGPAANPWDPRGTPTPPDTEGGALRAQDIVTSGDPLTYDGSVIRIDPATGNAVPGNPLWQSGVAPGAQQPEARVVAHGFRNPFRFTLRPGTSDLYVGDVGYVDWEEINKVALGGTMENAGWPCYEGGFVNGQGQSLPQGPIDVRNLTICEPLYDGTSPAPSTVIAPFFSYRHGAGEAPDVDGCTGAGASVSGLAFAPTGPYPASHEGGLVFADYAHRCVWIMYTNGAGNPNPSTVDTLVSGSFIVDVQAGPGSELYLVDIVTGKILRLTYASGNVAPVASIAVSDPTPAPNQSVVLDGSPSQDPHGDTLQYAWDLDGDGSFGAADGEPTTKSTSRSFPSPGTYTIRLRVTDFYGATSTTTTFVTVEGPNQAPIAVDDRYGVAEGTTLTVGAAAGVLANDTDADLDQLTAQLVGAPTHAASFTLNPNGSFSYTHDGSETTTDVFTYRASDGSAVSPTVATVTLDISPRNDPPSLTPIEEITAPEETLITFVVSATDPDPGAELVYSIVSGPAGATIGAQSGVFSWTPHEEDGPATYPVTIAVTDGIASDQMVVTIVVTEANLAPVVISPGDQATAEGGSVNLAINAHDPDAPPTPLTFTEVGLPPGLSLHPGTGVISGTLPFTTSGTYPVTVTVTDSGVPQAATSVSFSWIVSSTNQPPRLDPIPDQTGNENELITFTATAEDPDEDAVVFSLVPGPDPIPSGAAIDPVTGVFTWTPTPAQSPSTVRFSVRVTDDGQPALFDNQVITFAIGAVNEPPSLGPVSDRVVAEGTTLSFVVTATDPDFADTLTFSLEEQPAGATIDAETGAFSWTPGEQHGPGSHAFTIRVTDDGDPTLSDVAGIVVLVTEVNRAPSLNPPANLTVSEHELLSINVGASDPDIPSNKLTYTIATGPPGMTINPLTGLVTWTPGEDAGGTQVSVTVHVNDDGDPILGDQATFTIDVVEANGAPQAAILAPGGSLAWIVDQPVFFEGTATDPEDGVLPDSAFTWSLLLHHCATLTDCHVHDVQTTTGASGSFDAPDHEYPSYLELVLEATDSAGLTTVVSRDLYPATVDLTITSSPPGLQVYYDHVYTTPFTLEVIVNSLVDLAVPPSQTLDGRRYDFVGWSDGGEMSHTFSAPSEPTTISVVFANDAPVTRGESYTVERGRKLLAESRLPVNVLSNDSDEENDPMIATLFSGPSHAASFTLNPDGSFSYVHDGSAATADAFVYRAFDGDNYSLPAVVNLDIVGGPHGFIRLPGKVGEFIRSKDAPEFAIDGIDVRLAVAPDVWQLQSGRSYLAGQVGPISKSWRFGLIGSSSGSKLTLQVHNPRSVSYTSAAPVPFADGEVGHVRATWDPITGTAHFYTSIDGITWTGLGPPVSGLPGALNDSRADFHVGAGTAAGKPGMWSGAFYWMELRDGASGPVVARFDATTTEQLITLPPQYARWRSAENLSWLLRGKQRTWVNPLANQAPIAFLARPRALTTVDGIVNVSVKAGDVEDPPGSLVVYVSLDGGDTWRRAKYRTQNKRYQYDWDSTQMGDSEYVVMARVRDSAGNRTRPDTRRIWVGNELPYALELPGEAGTVVRTAAATRLDVDDLDVTIAVSMESWSGSSTRYLVSRWSGDRPAWRIGVDAKAHLVLQTATPSRTTTRSARSVPFSDGETGYLRLTRDSATGTITFWASDDGDTWVMLGSPRSGAKGALARTNARLVIGAGNNSGEARTWPGSFSSLRLVDGAAGTVVADLDMTKPDQLVSDPPDFARWRDAAGNTWFVVGSGWRLLGPQ